jgi:predicted transport protein
VDIVPQKSRLRLSLNMEYADIIDPEGWCRDASNIGKYGNGDVEVGFNNLNQLEYIMFLIQQAFDLQFVEN